MLSMVTYKPRLAALLSLKPYLLFIVLINFSSFVSSEQHTQYVGCFKTNKPAQTYQMNGKNDEECVQTCFNGGYLYAGPRNNGLCECYNEEPAYDRRLPEDKCRVLCEDGHYCADGVMYITDDSLGVFDNSLGYMGCYAAHSVQGLMTGLMIGYATVLETMTPSVCIQICQNKGFMFAGVRNSDQCYCGNNEPNFQVRLPPTRCNQRCAGDLSTICGGYSEIAIYQTGNIATVGTDQTLFLEGCYSIGREKKDFMHYNNLGPMECVRDCRRNNYVFANLYDGAYCFCSNVLPSYYERRSLNECSRPCIGDPKYWCGNKTAFLVYGTGIREHQQGPAYMGCYKDNLLRKLKGKKELSCQMTPDLCISICTMLSFAYAGVQFSCQCFCGNENPLPQDKRPEAECSKPCKGDLSQTCGGVWRNAIYRTPNRAPGFDAYLIYLGCYEDYFRRKLNGYHINKSTMTPQLCVNICSVKSFMYAGVQNGKRCFCGNDMPLPQDKAPESECKKPCAGDKQFICGGWWRNSIYRTIAVEKQK